MTTKILANELGKRRLDIVKLDNYANHVALKETLLGLLDASRASTDLCVPRRFRLKSSCQSRLHRCSCQALQPPSSAHPGITSQQFPTK